MTAGVTERDFERLLEAVQGTGPSATDWIMAAAAVLTFAVALAAALYARKQIDEGKEARKQVAELEIERSQPYVVMYTEPSSASQMLIELVIKNYGQTAALDVRTDITPALRRTAFGSTELVAMPDVIPVLAPGQEWRTLWDSGITRKKSDLPDRHEGFVRYKGVGGAERSSKVVLDWAVYKTRRWVELKTVHHAAKALIEIQKNQKKWNESIHGGLGVVVRDGHRIDAENEAYYAEQIERSKDLEQMLFPEQPAEPSSPNDEDI